VLLGVTCIDCVVEPLLHTLPVVAELVSVTVVPSQMVVPPVELMVGVVGVWFTVTTIAWLTADEQPLATACAV
jgi:hypothetical protein